MNLRGSKFHEPIPEMSVGKQIAGVTRIVLKLAAQLQHIRAQILHLVGGLAPPDCAQQSRVRQRKPGVRHLLGIGEQLIPRSALHVPAKPGPLALLAGVSFLKNRQG